jgi:RING finger/CHY zinc finger protein 1
MELDEHIAATEVPKEMVQDKVSIFCYECNFKGNVSYHYAGLKCSGCGTYNTVRQ